MEYFVVKGHHGDTTKAEKQRRTLPTLAVSALFTRPAAVRRLSSAFLLLLHGRIIEVLPDHGHSLAIHEQLALVVETLRAHKDNGFAGVKPQHLCARPHLFAHEERRLVRSGADE